MLSALTAIVLASAPISCGGVRPAAIAVTGTITEAGATGSFASTIDLQSGFWKIARDNGVQQSIEGYDGVAWTYGNGLATVVDVPPLIPDAAARAFVVRLGWNDPSVTPASVTRDGAIVTRTYEAPNMSRVTVVSGADLAEPSRATIDADRGTETNTFSDWRCAGGMLYPFEQRHTEDTGETQKLHVQSVASAAAPAHDVFELPAPQAHGRITPSAPAAIRFSGKRDRHIIVDAAIGDKSIAIIFDTGAANYISPEAAQTLGLSMAGGVMISGIGAGNSNAGLARIPTMTIANGTLENEIAVVAPLPWPATQAAPVGLTGLEFLAEFRTTIDYPNQTIAFANFTDPMPPGAMQFPLTFEGHFPMVEASVNGASGWFGVDTGDGGSITLFKQFADRAGVAADPSLEQTTGGGVGGATRFTASHARTFSLGGLNLAKPLVRLSNASAGGFASQRLAGNLGGGLLHCFKVIFDYRHREMWLFSDASTEACLAALKAPV